MEKQETIIRASELIANKKCPDLPKNAVVFFMDGWQEHIIKTLGATVLPEPLPRFLTNCEVLRAGDFCFLDGGRGAPYAADTLEILAALGVENIISVGLCGSLVPDFNAGEFAVIDSAIVAEGTTSYYSDKNTHITKPDNTLLNRIPDYIKRKTVVSTDAPFRESVEIEETWRKEGASGVDMETSAIYAISKELGLKAIAFLLVSDVHAEGWDWTLTYKMKLEFINVVIKLMNI